MTLTAPWLIAGLILLCLLPRFGGAVQLIMFPESVVIPVGSTVRLSCQNDIARLAVCEGGSCTELRTYNCHPYGCSKDGMDCASYCATSVDCAGGSECNTSSGQCSLSFGSCVDASTIKTPNGQIQSCAPYKCIAGACQQQCSSPGDCMEGYTCQKSPTTKRYYCAGGG